MAGESAYVPRWLREQANATARASQCAFSGCAFSGPPYAGVGDAHQDSADAHESTARERVDGCEVRVRPTGNRASADDARRHGNAHAYALAARDHAGVHATP